MSKSMGSDTVEEYEIEMPADTLILLRKIFREYITRKTGYEFLDPHFDGIVEMVINCPESRRAEMNDFLDRYYFGRY